MVREVANEIARKVSELPYTHIVGGYSRVLTTTKQTYPVSQSIFINGKEHSFKGDYYPMIPKKDDSSIMFVEMSSSSFKELSATRYSGEGIGSISFWGNVCKIKGKPSLQLALLQDLNIHDCATGPINISIESTGIVEHQAKSKYKLTDENEYLDMHPYQLFQINFSFTATISKCPVQITVSNECKD